MKQLNNALNAYFTPAKETSAKAARHSRFQRGSGMFQCRVCHCNSRDTGDNGQLQLCPICFELAGYENQFNDDGYTLDESSKAEVRRLLAELTAKIGHDKAVATCSELAKYVLADTPAAAPAAPAAEEEGEGRAYVVGGDTEEYGEFFSVVYAFSNADAKRQARRIFKGARDVFARHFD